MRGDGKKQLQISAPLPLKEIFWIIPLSAQPIRWTVPLQSVAKFWSYQRGLVGSVAKLLKVIRAVDGLQVGTHRTLNF